MKRMTRFCLALFMIFTVAMPVFAANGNVTYSGNSGKFIFEPGSEYSPTDLFPELKDVMPGDILTQNIVVKNRAKKPVRISLRALGAHEDSVEFLSQLHLYVETAKETPVFEAAADETAQLTEWRSLGVLATGGETQLKVGLEIPADLDNQFQELIGYLDWEFMVEEIDDGGTQTGDRASSVPWMIGLGCSVLAIVMIVALRRRRNKKIVDSQTAAADMVKRIHNTEETAKGGTA